MPRRKKRMDKGLRLAIQFNGKPWLAEQLEIKVQSVNHWKRVPRKHIMTVHKVTGIPLSKLAPDLFK